MTPASPAFAGGRDGLENRPAFIAAAKKKAGQSAPFETFG
jgi:hypothetical protein